jgi:hypothetical protein
VWFAGAPEGGDWFERAFPGTRVQRQRGGDLGERLEDAFARSFEDRAERVVILGADVPTLPEATLTGAFRDLEEAAGVVGPSSDGGYVLIGLSRAAWPRGRALFHDVPWSTDLVFDVSLRRAAEAALELRVLPGWYDIDRPADLVRAAQDADAGSNLGRWLRSDAGRGILGV